MDLDRALAFSRYAKSALDGDPALRARIDATIAAPLDWTDSLASLDAAVAGGDPGHLAATLRAMRRHVFVHVLLPTQEVVLRVKELGVDPAPELVAKVEGLLGSGSILVEYAGRA